MIFLEPEDIGHKTLFRTLFKSSTILTYCVSADQNTSDYIFGFELRCLSYMLRDSINYTLGNFFINRD
jgi:hypothetical protein